MENSLNTEGKKKKASNLWLYQNCKHTFLCPAIHSADLVTKFSKIPFWKKKAFTAHSTGKESAYKILYRDPGLIPGSGRSPGERNGNPLQYSYLENFMDKGAWWVIQSMVRKVSDMTE